MKTILVFLVLPFVLFGQEDSNTESKSLFVALYTVGESWDMKKPPGEQSYFKEHSAFLKNLRDTKVIVQGARFGDTGMVVFNALDLKAAKELIHSDLALQNQLFKVEVHKFAPFYTGCIE